MSERLENGRLITGRLSVIRAICTTLAYDLSNHISDEVRTKRILTALIVAIEQDQLDSLWSVVKPWIAAEIERQDALAAQEPDLPPHGFFPGRPYPPDATEPSDAPIVTAKDV